MITIKGGWLGRIKIWKKWEDSRKEFLGNKRNPLIERLALKIVDWFLDGTQLSAFSMTALVALVQPDPQVAIHFGLAWWLFVMSSMGEEAGAVGDYKGAWGDYIDHKEDFGRWYGIKKGLIYGIAGGGLLTFVTGYVGFMIAGASFPLVYFIGNSIGLKVWKKRGWALSEPLYDLVWLCAIFSWLN